MTQDQRSGKSTMREPEAILARHLERYRACSYAALVGLMGSSMLEESQGTSGVQYQLEFQVVWDDRAGGNVRVLGSIDDGGLRAFVRLHHGSRRHVHRRVRKWPSAESTPRRTTLPGEP